MVVGARFTCMKGRLGQRGNKHIKHTETACFTCLRVWEGCRYVCEGEGMDQRGDEHIKHTRLGVFYVLEGRGGSVGWRTRKVFSCLTGVARLLGRWWWC